MGWFLVRLKEARITGGWGLQSGKRFPGGLLFSPLSSSLHLPPMVFFFFFFFFFFFLLKSRSHLLLYPASPATALLYTEIINGEGITIFLPPFPHSLSFFLDTNCASSVYNPHYCYYFFFKKIFLRSRGFSVCGYILTF